MKPCKILMTTLSLAVDWQAIFYSLSLFSNGDWTPLQCSPPLKTSDPKVFHPLHSPGLPQRAFRDVDMSVFEWKHRINEISFISKKHRIIFVRKSVTDRSNRQCLRKIIKFDESAKSFECSHIRSLIIEAIHDARFVHKLPILPYRPWKIAKHSSIQQDCAVSKRKNLPALNLLTNWFEQTQVSRPPHHSFVCIVWLEWLTDLFLLFTFLFFLFSWQLYYN